MTALLITPLIPPRTRPGGQEHEKTATARRLPVAAAPEVPAVPGDVVYGTGRIDESGRVADRAMTGVLGWQPGDRLTFTAAAGVVIARRDPAGMVTMPAKPYLVIPAALRRRCGLRAGDHVLLAASPGQDTLTAYSFAVVDQATHLRSRGATFRAAGDDPAGWEVTAVAAEVRSEPQLTSDGASNRAARSTAAPHDRQNLSTRHRVVHRECDGRAGVAG